MALRLKKAFQLDKETPEAKQLTQLGTDVAISAMMLSTSKKEMSEAMNERNSILRDTLLEQYNYIVAPNDKVLFLEQTSEIRIYNSNGTTQKEIHRDQE